ncbi:CoA transferase [Marinovum sp. 2_MG-2023]|uniref:CaiB/BaiF CoA transferase family protein n=1 Tax=unclassified Marinovum TaxID=2647166 RepID=UPI0026E2196D|nr:MULTISPECIES: CoA transferase [unclassified Marinovum]MDO6732607.1 CoA transferase [Marinovum sp. 2_MG-2023]MDO6781906.1 CoA transferase [Marinovum sp. 1_MG-2023]
MTGKAGKGALDGVRVLDFTQMMLGPLCTQTLADMGADVIKVERPGKGEWMRSMPMIGEFVGGDSAAFHSFNRNKRSVTVDLKSPEGREVLMKLAAECDVVVENFRSGVMDRLGLGYEDFKKANDTIIYASGSGWGKESYLAKKGWPGQDLLIQAMSGVMQNTGRASEPPTACGTPIADFAASQALAIGILGALIARDRHGVGQQVETNLYSATLNLMAQENFAVLNQGIELQRSEAGVASCWNDAPYGSYPTADGWVAIAMCPLDKLGALLGDETLGKVDPWHERDIAKRQIDGLTRQKTTAEIMEIFERADVWAAPIRTSAEAMQELIDLKSPRLVEMDHPKAGRIRAIANPITLSETPVTLRHVPPAVGEHTEEVLTELLGAKEVARLREGGVI